MISFRGMVIIKVMGLAMIAAIEILNVIATGGVVILVMLVVTIIFMVVV